MRIYVQTRLYNTYMLLKLMFFFYVDLVFRFRQGLYNIEVNYLLSITLSWNFEYIDKGIYFLRFFIDVLLVFRFDKVYT